MGAELAGIASVRYARLPGNQYKVLMRMCLMALDKPNRKGEEDRLYFGGWEPLALALGRDVPDGPGSSKRRRQLAAEVSRVCAQLVDAKAIEKLIDHPGTGNRQVYRIAVQPVDNFNGTGPSP